MKKSLLLLLLTLSLVFCALPALAADGDKSDATLDEILVNEDEVSIRNVMNVDVPLYGEEVELSFNTSHKRAEVEIKCSENCKYDEDDEILYLDSKAELGVKHTMTITVTSYDGDYTKKYTLNLTRAYSDDLLEGLTVNTDEDKADKGQVLLAEKDFKAATFSYELKLKEDSDAEYIYLWIDTDAANDVWVNGKKVKSKDRQPYEVELEEIKDKLELRIEDEDPLNCAVYSISLEQGTVNTAKEALDELYVSKSKSSSSSKLFDLYPEFDPDHSSYHVFLADGVDEVYVMAEAAKRKNEVFYADGKDDYNKEWYALSGVKEGTKLSIQVKDEDGKLTGVYTLVFHCGKGSDNNDTDLDSLSVSNQTGDKKFETVKLNKNFSRSIKEYTAAVPANNYKKIRIAAGPFDSEAYVLVNGELLGKDGYIEQSCEDGKSYTFDIQVIAANCDDDDSYSLTVAYGKVQPESAGAYLSGLSAKMYGGAALALSPVFNGEQMNYTANVENSVSYVSFYPTAASADCKIELFGYQQESGKWTNYYQLNEGINNIPIYVYQGESKEKANVYYMTIYRQSAQLSTVVSAQKLTVDGKSVQLNAYNINGNNFVKLRDIAYLLNGTEKQFQVGFVSASNSIFISRKTAYTSVGQENLALDSPKRVIPSKQSVYLDSAQVSPMTYNIDGNNYMMLRDLALLVDFGMSYDSASGTVDITTANSYSPNK